MLILYTTPMCPYCERVKEYFSRAGITYETRDVSTNAAYRDELFTLGGKMQVPFLVDKERGVRLYESNDIIAYVGKLQTP